MREVFVEGRTCGVCGSSRPDTAEVENAPVPAGAEWLYAEPDGAAPRGASRVRSGLAYASGYAAVAYLHLYALTPPASRFRVTGLLLVTLCRLCAPLALGLAYAAGASLDRSPEKSGRLAALFALLVGLCATIHEWQFVLPFLKFLRAF